MTQTAVEWLVRELNQELNYIPMTQWDRIREIVQQAKAMEKQQIENAYQAGQDNVDYTASFVDENGLENYYNETYGGKNAG